MFSCKFFTTILSSLHRGCGSNCQLGNGEKAGKKPSMTCQLFRTCISLVLVSFYHLGEGFLPCLQLAVTARALNVGDPTLKIQVVVDLDARSPQNVRKGCIMKFSSCLFVYKGPCFGGVLVGFQGIKGSLVFQCWKSLQEDKEDEDTEEKSKPSEADVVSAFTLKVFGFSSCFFDREKVLFQTIY